MRSLFWGFGGCDRFLGFVEVRSRLGFGVVRSLFRGVEGAIDVVRFGGCDRFLEVWEVRSLFEGVGDVGSAIAFGGLG